MYMLPMVMASNLVAMQAASGMEANNMYALRAKEFLKQLSVEKATAALNQEVLQSFLKDRISIAEKLIAKVDDPSLKEKEQKTLDSDWVFPFVLNHLDTNPNARVVYYYPKMAQENVAFVLRKKLKCRVSDEVVDFEESYKDTLEKVSSEEFGKRMDSVSSDEIENILLQGSKDFATAILAEINQKK